jgi:hypothetical protein
MKWVVPVVLLAGVGGLVYKMLPEMQRELNILKM